MKTVKTKGIIIAEKVMSDFDKMLTILTPNMGKIECVAKGVAKAFDYTDELLDGFEKISLYRYK